MYSNLAVRANSKRKKFKMESKLFVSSKLTFSENLRCLNLALLVSAVSQKRSLSSTCFVIAGQSIHSGKFKYLKYSENVNFAGTNNFESILVYFSMNFSHDSGIMYILVIVHNFPLSGTSSIRRVHCILSYQFNG